MLRSLTSVIFSMAIYSLGCMLVHFLILITSLVSSGALHQAQWLDHFAGHPYREKHNGEWYRLFTSGLVHADCRHLLMNMVSLYFGGKAFMSYLSVEKLRLPLWVIFLFIYCGGMFVAHIALHMNYCDMPGVYYLGSSAGVFAVLGAMILFSTHSKAPAFFQTFHAWLLPIMFLEVMYRREEKEVSHVGHLLGCLFGIGCSLSISPDVSTLYWRALTAQDLYNQSIQ